MAIDVWMQLIGNNEVAGRVAEHPDRFAGLAAVDLARPMEAVRELRRYVSELVDYLRSRVGRRKVLFGSNAQELFKIAT
jgi:hypothetical protein